MLEGRPHITQCPNLDLSFPAFITVGVELFLSFFARCRRRDLSESFSLQPNFPFG